MPSWFHPFFSFLTSPSSVLLSPRRWLRSEKALAWLKGSTLENAAEVPRTKTDDAMTWLPSLMRWLVLLLFFLRGGGFDKKQLKKGEGQIPGMVMGMLSFFFGGGRDGQGKVWKRNLLIERWHGHPCARIAQKDVNRQNWTTSWTFFHCNSCNRKKNHEKSPSRLGGLEDVLAMWKLPAPLGNDPVWKSCCSFWIWMVQLPTGHAFSRNIMSIRYWTRVFFLFVRFFTKETRKEGTNQKDTINEKGMNNAHENTWAVT